MTKRERPGCPIDWDAVAQNYFPRGPLINLNNGAVSPPTRAVQQAVERAMADMTGTPDYVMWSGLDLVLPATKAALGELVDADAGEIALNRNATEGLSTAIMGIELSPGDEVIVSDWDYPSALGGWRQRAARDGVVPVVCRFGLEDDDEAVIAAYSAAITPRTRVLHLTHMIHWTGKVLPVARLCAMAREQGVETLVDGAQSFCQIPLSFRKIGCDYFVTSLHKWLGAPVGNGMLVIRKDKIDGTWPLMAPFDGRPGDIDKFDHWNLGTYNSALQAGIPTAIAQYGTLGVEAVHQRLAERTRYWVDRARAIAGFTLHTDIAHAQTGAVSLFSIADKDSKTLEVALREIHGVHTKYRKVGPLEGLRVSPHLYTTDSDLNRFVAALEAVVRG